MFRKTKEFLSLQAEWYRKLKESGFDDIEDTDSPREYLKLWHSIRFPQKLANETAEHTAEHYAIASRFLHNYAFRSEQDRKIWEMYCEGFSLRQTSQALQLTLYRVHLTVQSLKLKLKEYSDHE